MAQWGGLFLKTGASFFKQKKRTPKKVNPTRFAVNFTAPAPKRPNARDLRMAVRV